ncbi:MAG: insulinase family protein, partial [Oscillospiraceae bacterium]|nr:insulinase family protein [Oscillospiraceae bacterium]
EEIKIENQLPREPEDVFLKKIEKKLEVSMPSFEIGFKEKPQSDTMKSHLMSEMLLEMIFGESTQFYQKLYSKGVINSTFGTEVMSGDGYFVNLLGGEAPDPELVYDEIVAEIERVKAEGLSLELFENIKKQFYGARVSSFNTVENVA